MWITAPGLVARDAESHAEEPLAQTAVEPPTGPHDYERGIPSAHAPATARPHRFAETCAKLRHDNARGLVRYARRSQRHLRVRLELAARYVGVRGDGPAIDYGVAMKQTTAVRIFLGLLILVAPAALSLVHPIAGWAVLALVAGTLVAKKRGSRPTACEPGVSSATDSSAVLNA